MSTLNTTREFIPGTTGWSADDLNDPEIERFWEAGAFEIVEGVLTLMPPAYFDGGVSIHRLTRLLDQHFAASGIEGDFATEADLIIGRKRVARPDLVFMTKDDLERQATENARRGKPTLKYGRLLIAPTLIVESMSQGHEAHDRETKFRWYAEAGVRNYWMLDAQRKTLECFKLIGDEYESDARGADKDEVQPSAFQGLVIPLAQLWV